MRVITSAPKGCWRFSIERTATGWPLSRSSSVATTVVVPRSNAIANRRAVVSPGSRSISSWSHDDRGDVEPGRPQDRTQRSQHLDRRMGLEVVEPIEHPLEVRALVLHRRLVEHEVALLHRRAQDHVAPDARQSRLRPSLKRRDLDDQVAPGRSAARQPPALPQLVGRKRPRVQRAHRHVPRDDPHATLLAGPVSAAGRVDRDPVPARRVEHGRAAGDANLRALGEEAQPDALGAVVGRGHHLLRELDPAALRRGTAHDTRAASDTVA